jgi:hypothetical protein
MSIDRLLGLLGAVLLITLVGGCHDQGSATTAGGTIDGTVEMATEAGEGEQLNGEADEMADGEAIGEMKVASQEASTEQDQERH